MYRKDNKLIDAVSMGADITSIAWNIENWCGISLQAHAASNTHVGTLYFQVSNDGTNWVNITDDAGNDSYDAASGSVFSVLANYTDLAAPFIRAFYDYTSGAGTLTVTIFPKERC